MGVTTRIVIQLLLVTLVASVAVAFDMIPIVKLDGYFQTEATSDDNTTEIAFQTQTIYDSAVVFKNSEFHAVPVNLFRAFPNATKMYLGNCGILRLSKKNLRGGWKLQQFYLESNKLEELPSAVFSDFPNLDVLDLRYNRISELDETSFLGLGNLQTLNLAGNFIANISSKILAPLKSLKHIHLNHNNIEVLPSNLFMNNHKVLRMFLHSNEISSVDTNALNYLDNPEMISMDYNRMDELRLPSMVALSAIGSRMRKVHISGQVKQVRLSRNILERLEIQKPWICDFLDVSLNKLRDITFLSEYTNLKVLNLAFNPIDPNNFTREIFGKMQLLVDLDLSGAGIIFLPADIFADLTNLKELRMKKNFVSQFYSLFAALSPWRTSSSLENLYLESVSSGVHDMIKEYISPKTKKFYNVENIFSQS